MRDEPPPPSTKSAPNERAEGALRDESARSRSWSPAFSRLGGSAARSSFFVWLRALAENPDAAISAAAFYRSLTSDQRDAWLDVLAKDLTSAGACARAVFVPLLAVESEPARRERIRAAASLGEKPRETKQAWLGIGQGGVMGAVLVLPLYLSFVEGIVCSFHPENGVYWACAEPLTRVPALIEGARTRLAPIQVDRAPFASVIEEIAHAVVAGHRAGRGCPDLITSRPELFDPVVGVESSAPREADGA